MQHSIVLISHSILCIYPFTDGSDPEDSSEKSAEPDFADLACSIVLESPNMWKSLARVLGFGSIILDIEDHNPEGKSHCFATLFVLWKKRGRPDFTWTSLISALESVNEVDLAEALRQEYTGEFK